MHTHKLSLAAAAALLIPIFAAAVPQTGDTPQGVVFQGGNFYRFRVGALTVTSLSDGTVPQDLHQLLYSTTDSQTDALLRAAFL